MLRRGADMAAGRDVIVALVTHARYVPVAERERFAARLREDPHGSCLVLETCHRVEAYVVQPDRDPSREDWLPAGGRVLVGEAAIRHAIAVAVGRDSVVVGEDQILHQLRTSVDSAREGGGLQPDLERLFALGLRAGRRARSWRVGPGRSLADVAVSAIERQAGPLSGRQILVVGAGKMGRLAVRSALAVGASVSVANRSPGRTIPLVSETGAGIEAFDPGTSIARFSAVIVALAGPWTIAQATIHSLAASSTVVVDLSVPAAVPLGSVRNLGPRLVTADDLAGGDASPFADDERSLARLDALIAETTTEFCGWLELRDGRAAAAALAERADRERHAELDLLWRQLPDLDADAHEAIERMSRHLARRILREPLERLGRDADGRHERAARELFGL
jgi:glutamyl-tRNA reductase